MSLFDVWEKFYSQIYPQNNLDDEEEINLIDTHTPTTKSELNIISQFIKYIQNYFN